MSFLEIFLQNLVDKVLEIDSSKGEFDPIWKEIKKSLSLLENADLSEAEKRTAVKYLEKAMSASSSLKRTGPNWYGVWLDVFKQDLQSQINNKPVKEISFRCMNKACSSGGCTGKIIIQGNPNCGYISNVLSGGNPLMKVSK